MSDRELVGFLGRKIYQAMNDEDGDLSDVRTENFNYYTGAEYGDERKGYSRFVTRETLETVEWVLPSVLRVFLAGDQVVAFDAGGPHDEASAEQETDIANHFVMKSNRSQGFLALHNWMKDALMYPNGYLKVYMEEATRSDVGTVTGVNEFGLNALVEDKEVTILEQRERIEGIPGMEPFKVFDLKIRTTKDIMELRLQAVPPEECLVDNDLMSPDLDEADFVCHRVQKPYTTLVEEGFDPDELDEVGQGENYQWNDERTNRLFYEDEDPDAEDEDDRSMRQFWVHECYARVDYDGDGLGERRKITLIGDKVFENEETNYQPLVSLSSILMQHKHTGMSYVDIMKDLQLLLSILTRQLLDNIYQINVGKTVFSEDALTDDGGTMEALLNTQAKYVPVRGPAAQAWATEPIQPIVESLLPVIQHFDAQRVQRTGVSPEATIDANSLQEVRQEVFANAMDRASQRIEMLVRIFAETGYRQLMLKVHQLLRSHWDIPKAVKIRGDWVDVRPQDWGERTEMSVNVGLGIATKQQMLGMIVQLLSIQKEAAGQGMADAKKIYNGLEKLVSKSGLGDVRQFFIDPESQEFQPPEPQPDPNMILAQAQAQALQSEGARKDQELQLKMQTEPQQAQVESQIKMAELEGKKADREIKMRELALKEREMMHSGQLKEGELQATIENIRADTKLKGAQADKQTADAAATAAEASDTYNTALEIIEKENSDGERSAESASAETEAEAEAGNEAED